MNNHICVRCNKTLASPQSLWNHRKRCNVDETKDEKQDEPRKSRINSTSSDRDKFITDIVNGIRRDQCKKEKNLRPDGWEEKSASFITISNKALEKSMGGISSAFNSSFVIKKENILDQSDSETDSNQESEIESESTDNESSDHIESMTEDHVDLSNSYSTNFKATLIYTINSCTYWMNWREKIV